jgi:hypothetical protein
VVVVQGFLVQVQTHQPQPQEVMVVLVVVVLVEEILLVRVVQAVSCFITKEKLWA